MTPETFAAILDDLSDPNIVDHATEAAINLAPLLLDLWRAAKVWEAHDPHHHEGTVCLSQDELRVALAALEALG